MEALGLVRLLRYNGSVFRFTVCLAKFRNSEEIVGIEFYCRGDWFFGHMTILLFNEMLYTYHRSLRMSRKTADSPGWLSGSLFRLSVTDREHYIFTIYIGFVKEGLVFLSISCLIFTNVQISTPDLCLNWRFLSHLWGKGCFKSIKSWLVGKAVSCLILIGYENSWKYFLLFCTFIVS